KKLLAWRVFITALFLVMMIPQMWTLFIIDYFEIPPLVLYLNNFTSSIFTIFSILYDNIQGLYLIYLVQSKKKHMGDKATKILNHLVISLVCLSIMDWIGFAIFAIGLFIPAIVDNYILFLSLITFADSYTGIHAVAMIFVLKLLTDFTFVEKKSRLDKVSPKKNIESGPLTLVKN
ncbi:hypothetical protein HDV06_001529, partial [Boothiomyces sp. JEL0866]